MAGDFAEVEHWLSGLLAQLAPKARGALAREIAQRLRESNRGRIAAQVGPDGTPYPPRLRQKHGRIRRAMFIKLRTARWMKARATADEAVVEFIGQAGRIARIHHEGLRDRVKSGGAEHQYAERPLLGLSDADLAAIEDMVVAHLGL